MMSETYHEHSESEDVSGIDVPLVFTIGMVTTILMIVIVIACKAWYYKVQQDTIAEAQYHQVDADRTVYEAEQAERLNRMGWHPGRKTANVPLERAMQLMKDKYEDCGCPDDLKKK